MKTVKEIQEFFLGRKDDKELSLGDLMDTVPRFIIRNDETKNQGTVILEMKEGAYEPLGPEDVLEL